MARTVRRSICRGKRAGRVCGRLRACKSTKAGKRRSYCRTKKNHRHRS